ncbi:MAG: hypothetical protein J6V09_03705 [Clostridia bacterium]|nr:hypothetical protein [Clostridia bacterium]
MRKKQSNKVKILVSIIGREDEEKLADTINSYCTAMHFSGLGHGTAHSHHRSYFGFDEVDKRVTFSLIPENLDRKLLSAINRNLKLYLLGKGIAFTMPISAISSIVEEPILAVADKDAKASKTQAKKKERKTMHELVIAVVSEKYSDTAIDAARSAGATGATIFHTRSVSNAKIEEAMGTSLPTETDTVFILTSAEYKMKIMEAIRDSAGLKTDGGAIIFSVPVDDLVGIGRFAEELEEE